MSQDLRMLAALQEAEAHAGAGCRVAYCLDHAASAHAVNRGELAERWIEKRIEVDRARDAVASMNEADSAA